MGGGEVSVRAALDAVVSLLDAHRRELDALNVFPVPDGDTGRNVVATVRAAAAAAAAPGTRTPAAAAVDGALRGARGNSGVLLSQALRGLLGDRAGRFDEVTPEQLAAADTHARAAVADPVEGSLLSATRAAADAARDVVRGERSPADVLRAARTAAHEAVARTPAQLEVLARAGVVDAGARAYALLLEALFGAVTGTAPSPPAVHVPADGPASLDCVPGGGRYEVMYLLDPTPDADVALLRRTLATLGDSVVVVDAGELLSVHVHADDVDAVTAAGAAHGQAQGLRVEDLRAAVEAAARAAGAGPASGGPAAVLAGIQGEGLASVVESTGVTPLTLTVGALPSVADLLDAAAATGAARVVLLPGHRDVVPTAHQAAALAGDRTIEVVAGAVDAARVLAAVSELDPAAPDVAVAASAVAAVRAGEVVAAVRDADTAAGPVLAGDWLAVVDGSVVGAAASVVGAVELLVGALGDGEPEVAMVFVGRELSGDDLEASLGTVTHRWPGAELDVFVAGQVPAVLVVGVVA